MATEAFIILPWDREVIMDGELVLRPDYAEELGDVAGGHHDSTDS